MKLYIILTALVMLSNSLFSQNIFIGGGLEYINSDPNYFKFNEVEGFGIFSEYGGDKGIAFTPEISWMIDFENIWLGVTGTYTHFSGEKKLEKLVDGIGWSPEHVGALKFRNDKFRILPEVGFLFVFTKYTWLVGLSPVGLEIDNDVMGLTFASNLSLIVKKMKFSFRVGTDYGPYLDDTVKNTNDFYTRLSMQYAF